MLSIYRETKRTDLITETKVAVGVAAGLAIIGRPSRSALVLSNAGATIITVGLSPTLPVGQGITLQPSGPPIVLKRCDLAPWIVSTLYAISSAAGGILSIVEIYDEY